MNKFKGFLFLGLLLAGLPLQAALEIRITQGISDATPIAITPFSFQGKGDAPGIIGDIVIEDLKRSGRFSPLDKSGFAQPDANARNLELYRWREKNINYVVVGSVHEQEKGKYKVQFQLFDALDAKQLAGYSIPTDTNNFRMAAHQVSDLIYEAVLGVRGAFNTRIVYITTQGKGDEKRYILQVADSDGHNARTVLNSRSPLMSPVWSPDTQQLAYVSFENNRSNIYIQDVVTGERQKVSSRQGINGAPAWSPDGRRLALTLSETGSPEIYVLDIKSKRLAKLTSDRAINTEPVWTPDGKSIVFTSNRTGKPQLYRVSASGGSAQRLSYEGELNAAPAISADGKKIAMVNGERGRFRIAVLDLQSGETQVLTNGKLDESPSFAPNGSMIIYATEEKGRGVLAAVSDDGRVRQTLVLQEGEVREPDWSPFIN
ncbi:MAG: Tol-Pal system protein TolB [Thiothrix sp.]|nr:MAG: Tol-Pal system protein TolB [Thiothrix sp.]